MHLLERTPGRVDYGIFGYENELDQDLVNQSLRTFGDNMSYNHVGNVSFKWYH